MNKRAAFGEQQMQDGAEATGNGEPLDCNGYNIVMLQVDGISGDTITLEATLDGETWHTWPAKDDAGAEATTITEDGLYRMGVFAVHQVQARISTYGSGTIYVLGRATA